MTVGLRTAPVADVRAVDLRAADRDLWADEAAIRARLPVDLDRIPAPAFMVLHGHALELPDILERATRSATA